MRWPQEKGEGYKGVAIVLVCPPSRWQLSLRDLGSRTRVEFSCCMEKILSGGSPLLMPLIAPGRRSGIWMTRRGRLLIKVFVPRKVGLDPVA